MSAEVQGSFEPVQEIPTEIQTSDGGIIAIPASCQPVKADEAVFQFVADLHEQDKEQQIHNVLENAISSASSKHSSLLSFPAYKKKQKAGLESILKP